MDCLQHGAEWLRTFRAVEKKCALRGFDELGLFLLEDSRRARVFGFSIKIIF